MARLNIADEWWTDPRRFKLIELVGDEFESDGLMMSVWLLAQTFWKNDKRLIPKPVFMKIPGWEKILSAGLAAQARGAVYVKGSKEHHQWLIERQESGRLGGKARARNNLAKKEFIASAKSVEMAGHVKPLNDQQSEKKKSVNKIALDTPRNAALGTSICNDEENFQANVKQTPSKLQASYSYSYSYKEREEREKSLLKFKSEKPESAGEGEIKNKIRELFQEWIATHEVMKMVSRPSEELSQPILARCFLTYGFENTRYAVIGYRAEVARDGYDPKQNVNLSRLEKRTSFEKLRNLGAEYESRAEKKRGAETAILTRDGVYREGVPGATRSPDWDQYSEAPDVDEIPERISPT